MRIKMKIINFASNLAMPMIILLIVAYGLKEKNKVFDTFLVGAKEGIETTFKIFPTLIGLFVAIGALRSSGILECITHIASPILNLINFPGELMPLALLRPVSGSGSMAIATDIMKKLWSRHHAWNNGINNYGVNRNDILYNCTIYKCSRN